MPKYRIEGKYSIKRKTLYSGVNLLEKVSIPYFGIKHKFKKYHIGLEYEIKFDSVKIEFAKDNKYILKLKW